MRMRESSPASSPRRARREGRHEPSVHDAPRFKGERIVYSTERGHAWLQVVHRSGTLNGQADHTSDGATVTDECELTIEGFKASLICCFSVSLDAAR